MPDTPAAALPFPVLIADIGGTNARFAVVPAPGAAPERFVSLPTAGFADPIAAIESLGLAAAGLAPKSAVMALAAPITGDSVTLTNCPWTIEPKRMIERLGLDRVVLLNDFEALALALPDLAGLRGTEDVVPLGGGAAREEAAMVVIGPGTGLGVAILIHAMGRWIPVPGEGGHVDLAPHGERETAVWRHVERIGGRVTAETILSGGGLLRLARAVAAADGLLCPHATPEAVTAGAEAGEPVAVETVTIFARALGRLAGDFALTSLARGGVFVAGGVSLKIERRLTDGTFRKAFEDKAPHGALVAGIPTWLVRHPRAAHVGLAAFANDPDRFGVDLTGRVWRA